MEDEVYLLAVTRYIHLNPVKIAACRRLRASERFERLEAYPWSSYGGYAAANKALQIDARLFSAHGRSAGCAKSVAVELAAQLADLSGRAVGEHYGMCANGVGANRRRLATRPEVLQVVETLGRKLRRRKLK